MLNKPFFKIISIYLVISVFVITLPSQGWAVFLASGQAASVRQADMTHIQKTLESAVVKQRPMDLGISSKEALARTSSLSDEQIHRFAADLGSLQAGGDAIGFLVSAVVLALLIVLLIFLVQGRIVIK